MTTRSREARACSEVDSMREAGIRVRRRLLAGALAARSRGRHMGTTVLIVEDDHNIGNLVRTYLERDGYGVVWVRSGEEGLALSLIHISEPTRLGMISY